MTAVSRIVDVVISAGIFNGLFLALVLTTKKNKRSRSNRILAALLVVLSVSIAHSLIWIGVDIGVPFQIREPFILLIGPFLLLYVRETVHTQKPEPRDSLHFIPFLLFFVIILLLRTGATAGSTAALSIGVWILTLVQYGFYWWYIVQAINRSLPMIESEYSNMEGKSLSWIKSFLHIFGVCLLLLTLTIPIAVHMENYPLVDTIVCLALSCTVFVVGYEGLFQEEIFSNLAYPEQAAGAEEGLRREEDAAPAPSPEDGEMLRQLLKHMEEKRPYLDERLTLTQLAAQLGLTRNQLSFLINERVGENFYAFINKYRVEEVKRLIADPAKNHYTILALAYESGFPSKSSFQAIFKKFTGLTPTAYRNRPQ